MSPSQYSGGAYPAPTARGPLQASVRLPGSKSLTNRELVLAALATGPSRLRAPLHARDTELMAEALRALGADIQEAPASGEYGADWLVTPGALRGPATIDVGLAGTVMRFVPPLAALASGEVRFDGDESARRRPMSVTIDSLRALGVEVDDGGTGRLPFTTRGTGAVRGGSIEIDASASSQFVSGLLLAAPRFAEGLRLRHTGQRLPSLPHIEMTVACLAARGVAVDSPEPGVWTVAPQPIEATDAWLEPDLSNAAPFLAAAVVTGGSVSVTGWPSETTQVGAELPRLLEAFGGRSELADGVLTVHGGGRISAVDLDLTIGGELAPTLAGLAALADGPSRLIGIGHLRGHETDRLAALATDLGAIGCRVVELDDGLEIHPGPLHGAPWGAYEDHRMATTGALLGLAVPGIVIDDIATTAKTLPEFRDLWERMVT